MLRDYVRILTDDQNLNLQNDALQKAGCDKIHFAQIGGATPERRDFATVFNELRPGDTPVILRLDRLGRYLKHLIQSVGSITLQGVAGENTDGGVTDVIANYYRSCLHAN